MCWVPCHFVSSIETCRRYAPDQRAGPVPYSAPRFSRIADNFWLRWFRFLQVLMSNPRSLSRNQHSECAGGKAGRAWLTGWCGLQLHNAGIVFQPSAPSVRLSSCYLLLITRKRGNIPDLGHHTVELLPIAALRAFANGIALAPRRYLVRQRDAHQLINADLLLLGQFFKLFGQRVGNLKN